MPGNNLLCSTRVFFQANMLHLNSAIMWYWFSLVWFEKIWWVAAESESGRAVGKEEQLKIDCPRSAKKSYKSTRLQNSAAVEFLVFRSKVQFVSNFQENVLTFLTEGSTSPQTNFSSTANHFRSFDFCTIFPRSWLRKEVSCPRLIALNVPKANGSGCYSSANCGSSWSPEIRHQSFSQKPTFLVEARVANWNQFLPPQSTSLPLAIRHWIKQTLWDNNSLTHHIAHKQ